MVAAWMAMWLRSWREFPVFASQRFAAAGPVSSSFVANAPVHRRAGGQNRGVRVPFFSFEDLMAVTCTVARVLQRCSGK
jgi:hypothetical protein